MNTTIGDARRPSGRCRLPLYRVWISVALALASFAMAVIVTGVVVRKREVVTP